MKRVILFLPVLLALVLVQTGFTADKAGPRLEEIRFETRTPAAEQVIFRLNSIRIPRVFAIKGKNPRVVFDFPDTTVAGSLASTINTNGRYIRRIRMGLHGPPNPKTRVVLDLVPGAAVDFRQKFDQAHKSLIVTLFRAGAAPEKTAGETPPSTPPAEKKPVVAAEKKSLPAATTEKAAGQVKAKKPLPAAAEKVAGQAEAKKSLPGPARPAPQPKPLLSAKAAAPAPATARVQVEAGREKAAAPRPAAPAAPAKTAPARPAPGLAGGGKTPAGGTGKKSAPASPAAATGPVLRSITFDKSSNRGEMVLFKLSEFHPPVVFGIEEGVPRVVCDFKGTTAEAGVRNRINANGRYVRTIRVGRHRNPDKIRVVLDLEPNNNYDLQQVFFKDDNLFVIIINTIGNAPTRKEVEKPLARKAGS